MKNKGYAKFGVAEGGGGVGQIRCIMGNVEMEYKPTLFLPDFTNKNLPDSRIRQILIFGSTLNGVCVRYIACH